MYDGLLLEGALSEYEAAFKAVDSSGNGTIGTSARPGSAGLVVVLARRQLGGGGWVVDGEAWRAGNAAGATELAQILRSTGNGAISYESMVDIMTQYDRDESGQIEVGGWRVWRPRCLPASCCARRCHHSSVCVCVRCRAHSRSSTSS